MMKAYRERFCFNIERNDSMKKTNRFMAVVIALILVFALPASASAMTIYVDDMYVESDGALIRNNRTMVPVRAVAEMMGCRVDWDPDNQGIYIYDPHTDEDVLDMWIDDYSATLYMHDKYTGEVIDSYTEYMDSPPVLINSKTYVPLRFIAEALGYVVEYNADGYVDLYSYDYYYSE